MSAESSPSAVEQLTELLRSAGATPTITCPTCKWEGGEVVEHAPDCLSLLPPAFMPLLSRLVGERDQYRKERDQLELAVKSQKQCIHILDRPTHFMVERWKKLEALAHRVRHLLRCVGEFPDGQACWGEYIDAVDAAYEALDPKSPFVEFQRLWSASVGLDGYSKFDWMQLEARLLTALRSADGDTVTKTLAEAYFLAPTEMH